MQVSPDPVAATETLVFLAELTLKGTLVLGMAAAIAFILRRSPAADRHAVWFVAMAGIVLLPTATALLPDWKVIDPSPWIPETMQLVANDAVDTSRDIAAAPQPDPTINVDSKNATSVPPGSGSTSELTSINTGANPVVGWLTRIVSGPDPVHWTVLLFWVWIAGAGLILMNLILGAMQLLRISGRSRPVRGTEWRDLADEIGDRLFLTRDVLILTGSSTTMPMTWGGFRPVVLLPFDADSWSSERKRCVLTHEFAHIKRWDTTTQGIAQIACAVFWFNPLVWVAASRLRAEREKACDETVIELGMQPSDYADHLLDLARTAQRSTLHPLGAVAMAKPTQLEGRVISILRNRPHGFSAGRTVRIATLMVAAILFIPLAALSPATSGAEVDEVPTGPPAAFPPAAVESDADSGIETTPPATITRERLVQEAPADTIDVRRERLAAVFVEALRDSDPDIRRNAARMLSDLEVESAIDALGETLATDSDKEVRRTAAWALGEFEDAASLDVLLNALRDSDAEVRSMAVWALGQLEDERAVDALTTLLQDESPDVRRRVMWALQEIESPGSLDTFIAASRDDDPEVRRFAALGLNELEDPAAVGALIEMLGDENEDVRVVAAHALGEIEDDRAAVPLAGLLEDPSLKVRRAAIHALSQFETHASRDALISAVKADDREVRLAAVTALHEFEDVETVRAIEDVLTGDSDGEVRMRAARTLIHMETDEALDALDRALSNGGEVRDAVMQALGRR